MEVRKLLRLEKRMRLTLMICLQTRVGGGWTAELAVGGDSASWGNKGELVDLVADLGGELVKVSCPFALTGLMESASTETELAGC